LNFIINSERAIVIDWVWFWKNFSTNLWLRSSLFGVFGFLVAMLSLHLNLGISNSFSRQIGVEALDSLLNILAASMLSVTIFSLSTLVMAYGSVTDSVTPRATKLLMEDQFTQTALSTFIGSFIFSIVGIVALKTGSYDDANRLILFIITIIVIIIIVLTLLKWIEYLSHLGRFGDTIILIENACHKALHDRIALPTLGANLLWDHSIIEPHFWSVHGKSVGYVRFIEMSVLEHVAHRENLNIYILAVPGTFVTHSLKMVWVDGPQNETIANEIRRCFVVEQTRDFTQDPLYCLEVLNDVAVHSLLTSLTGTSTAKFMISVAVRVYTSIANSNLTTHLDEKQIHYPHLYMPLLSMDELFDGFFRLLSRHAIPFLDIELDVLEALVILMETKDPEMIRVCLAQAEQLMRWAEQGPLFEEEKMVLRKQLLRVHAAAGL
jgi:uncharacterized membrane protein